MKKQERIVIIIMVYISMLFSVLTINAYAENENNIIKETNTTNTTNTENIENTINETSITNTSNTTNTASEDNSTEIVKEEKKSSNANLSNLGIKPYDFTGFRYGTTNYEVEVPLDVKEVEIYAEVQDSKATLTGTGNKKLEIGENKAEVTVTAEDGTKKTYTINIIRKEMQEKTVDTQNSDGLSELKISNVSLSPEFKTYIYEYTANYIGKDTKLQIEAKPTDENYIVEIIGNNNLIEGENIITILVSEENEDNVAIYQVIVNKSLVDVKAQKNTLIIIGIILAIIIVGSIVFVVIKRRKNRDYTNKYSEVYIYEKNDEEEDYNEELPKALRENKTKRKSTQHDYSEKIERRNKGKRYR